MKTRVRGSVIAVMVGAKIFCQLPTRQLLVALTILPTRRLVNKIYLLVNPENLFFDFVKNPDLSFPVVNIQSGKMGGIV